jgi:hypothetical protein
MDLFNDIRIEQAVEEIELHPGFPEGWNVDSLNDLHSVVGGILHENQDRIEDNWSITFAELCRIIQQERAQAKFEQDFDYYKKMKAASKK